MRYCAAWRLGPAGDDARLPDSGPTLVFVYHADEGWGAAMFDAAHKILSPATYGCSLCTITYGAVAMKREWRTWIESQANPPQFFHKQDFARAYPAFAGHGLPAIYAESDGALMLLMDDAAIREAGSVSGLIAALENRLSQ